jgi:hypothetical protein
MYKITTLYPPLLIPVCENGNGKEKGENVLGIRQEGERRPAK